MKKLKLNYKTLYLIHFMVCELVFSPLMAVLLIYHGPFTNLRDYIVSTSMATNGNRFFATWFLSKSEISRILAKTNSVVKDGKENVQDITILSRYGNGGELQAGSSGNKTGIRIINIAGKNFKGKLIIVNDPSKIVLGLAPKLGQAGAPLSEIINKYHAVGGINAGGFLDDNLIGTGAKPDGIVIEDGKIKFQQSSYRTFNVIGFNKNNVLVINNKMTLDEMSRSNLKCAISFGPALILNGQPLVTVGGSSLQPRSAIGQKKSGAVLLLAIDGRQPKSAGANYKDVEDIMLQYGAYNAANLDGGSSTTLDYEGKTLNNPCNITGERSIATAFIIMP